MVNYLIKENDLSHCVGAIRIRGFDLLKRENEPKHITHHYSTNKTVLRRGFGFTARIFLSKEYDQHRHALNVEFRRGVKPGFLNSSRFECIIDRRAVRNWEWRGSVKARHDKSVDVEVDIPVDTPVGEYEVIAEVVDLKTNRQDCFKAERNVVILFNPWDSSECIVAFIHFVTSTQPMHTYLCVTVHTQYVSAYTYIIHSYI